MHSSMIGKVEKAMRYAHEPDRVKLSGLTASFAGDNGTHTSPSTPMHWHCDCHLFESAGGCSHTLAIQKMLDPDAHRRRQGHAALRTGRGGRPA